MLGVDMATGSTSSAQAAQRASQQETMDAIATCGILQSFVRENGGQWDHKQWLGLLDRLRGQGFFVDPDLIGIALERERTVYRSGQSLAQRQADSPEASRFLDAGPLSKDTSRENNLSMCEISLRKAQEDLKARFLEWESHQEGLARREAALDEKAALLMQQEQEVGILLKREQDIARKHASLIEREQELDKAQASHAQTDHLSSRAVRAEAHIAQLQAKVIESHTNVHRLEAALHRREEELAAAQENIARLEEFSRKIASQALAQSPKAVRQEFKDRLQQAGDALKEAKRRLKAAAAKEKALQDKETLLARRENRAIETEFSKLLR